MWNSARSLHLSFATANLPTMWCLSSTWKLATRRISIGCELFLPRLRDAFVVDLHNLATIRNPDQGLINMRRVKYMLKKTTLEVLGPNVVHDVLVQLAQ